MGLFDRFKKKEQNGPDFSSVDSNEKAMELAKQGVLQPLYMMPLRFNGEESERNRLFVPPFVVELKARYDDMVEELLVDEKVSSYSCTPDYKDESFVPSALTIEAGKDGMAVFTQKITIW